MVLVLLDIPMMETQLGGLEMELEDCTLPLLVGKSKQIYSVGRTKNHNLISLIIPEGYRR